jgi:hypothetical protein
LQVVILDAIASGEIAVRAEQPPALPDAEVERAKDYARAARAALTRRVYASVWSHSAAWCTARGMATL